MNVRIVGFGCLCGLTIQNGNSVSSRKTEVRNGKKKSQTAHSFERQEGIGGPQFNNK
jgi:hypothetical protein